MSETVKAIAKAVEASANAITPLTSVTGRILGNLLEEPSTQLGGLLADRLRARRIENLRHIGELTIGKLEERELLDAPLPLGFLGPALEHAADVDEPELQELWAELIANGAAAEENQHPSFAQTLASMDARDANTFVGWLNRAGTPPATSSVFSVGSSEGATPRLAALGLLESRDTGMNLGPRRREPTPAELYQIIRRQQPQMVTGVSGYGVQFARAVGLIPRQPA